MQTSNENQAQAPPQQQSPPPQQQHHTPNEHLTKMSEMMNAEIRKMRAELEQERAQRAQLEKERLKLEEINSKSAETLEKMAQEQKVMNAHIERIKAEKRQQYQQVIDNQIKPYFKTIEEKATADNDPSISASLAQINSRLEAGLKDGFLDSEHADTLLMAKACASAHNEMYQQRSSALDELFKTNEKWEHEMSNKNKELEAVTEKYKTLETETTSKIGELQKQLEDMQAKYAKQETSIHDSTSHFENDTASAEQQQQQQDLTNASLAPNMTAMAVASAADQPAGYDSLFSNSRNLGWRSLSGRNVQFDMMSINPANNTHISSNQAQKTASSLKIPDSILADSI